MSVLATAPPAPAQRVRWRYAGPILLVHMLALLAFVPWFFSWTGVVLVILGAYVYGTLGINIGYHRLLTHRSFDCPRWLAYSLAVLGACSAQDSPSVLAATHRRHHESSDEERDPHSPVASFIWGHVGWLMIKRDDMKFGPLVEQYAKDIQRDPFYAWLDRGNRWITIALASWVLYFVVGYLAAIATGSTSLQALQFGLSLLVWGCFVRLVVVWHITWAVNSAAHSWGYRNYDTPDFSRNNVIVALISNGEGWHNNHHADPRSARHGHKWWEFDVSWLTIRLVMLFGLASNVALPSTILEAKFNSRPPTAI